jgi:hypothetical protein
VVEARYTLDGEDIDIEQFLFDNRESFDFDRATVARVRAMRAGDEMTFGGGAAATFVLRREVSAGSLRIRPKIATKAAQSSTARCWSCNAPLDLRTVGSECPACGAGVPDHAPCLACSELTWIGPDAEDPPLCADCDGRYHVAHDTVCTHQGPDGSLCGWRDPIGQVCPKHPHAEQVKEAVAAINQPY